MEVCGVSRIHGIAPETSTRSNYSKGPLRVIAPGRCFRRDTVDATHSANFHQTEGLFIDHKVTVRDLKGVLDFFRRELFGEKVETRLRPSFFPFTEPSF